MTTRRRPTSSTVDPSRVILTGENPFIRLAQRDDGPASTDASFWRILFSPAGPGHVLFLTSELAGNEPTIYSDNPALARWLQQEIQVTINPLFGNPELPVHESTCQSSGDLRSFWTEAISTTETDLALTWYDLGEPFLVHSLPGSNPQRPHGVCTLLIPAAGARVTLNGQHAKGRPFPRQRDGRTSSTCCLAFSESWLLPR